MGDFVSERIMNIGGHTPNKELHMQPHLPRFYHNNT